MSTMPLFNPLFWRQPLSKEFLLLILFLAMKAILMVAVILYAGIHLSPDEAQYWTWSQYLDWGYYSKPPGIAWQIWLGTKLFGSTELGVRFFAVILGFIQSLAVYTLARNAGLSLRGAFWSSLLMAFSPIGWIGSFQTITDGGMLLFWTLASSLCARELNRGNDPNAMKIGFYILCGALFKWPIYFFWILYFFIKAQLFPSQKISKLISGISISLLGLLPSVWWNWSHDWATFRHVSALLQGGHGAATSNTLEFIGAQMLLMTPPLIILAAYTFPFFIKNWKLLSPSIYFIATSFFSSVIVALILSFFQKVQGNWIVFCYPAAIVWLAWYVIDMKAVSNRWIKSSLAFSCIVVCSVIGFSQWSWLPFNPLKHQLGWDQIKIALSKHGYDPEKHFLASDKYQTTSLLSFYGENQNRAYFLNLNGIRNNQFSYWPSLQQDYPAGDGYFIWIENQPYLDKQEHDRKQNYLTQLSHYFTNVKFVAKEPLLTKDTQIIKGALLFYCEGCRQLPTELTDLY